MPQPAHFNLSIADLINEASERAGYEARTGYDIRTARRSLDLLSVAWSNMGLNLWTILEGGIELIQGQSHYTLPMDTIDLLDVTVNNGQQGANGLADYSMTRISQTTWMQIVNKGMQGRPVQFMVQRQIPPVLVIWPVPNVAGYQARWWRMVRILDAGNSDTTMDVPSRFLEALVSGLAFHLAMKHRDPAIRANAPALKAYYEEQLNLAQGEDRDRASVRFVPRIIRA